MILPIQVSATEPADPVIGLIWLDISNEGTDVYNKVLESDTFSSTTTYYTLADDEYTVTSVTSSTFANLVAAGLYVAVETTANILKIHDGTKWLTVHLQ